MPVCDASDGSEGGALTVKGRDHLNYVLFSTTNSDTVRASQIRNGKWLAEGEFSVTNLGSPDCV